MASTKKCSSILLSKQVAIDLKLVVGSVKSVCESRWATTHLGSESGRYGNDVEATPACSTFTTTASENHTDTRTSTRTRALLQLARCSCTTENTVPIGDERRKAQQKQWRAAYRRSSRARPDDDTGERTRYIKILPTGRA